MRILEITVNNFKRLVHVHFAPSEGINILAGSNGEGKSSLIHAARALLGGKDSKLFPNPIHEGAEKAEIVGVIGGDGLTYNVRRVFTEKGSRIQVTTAPDEHGNVQAFRSEQKMLNRFLGAFTFDPLGFLGLTPKKQVDALKTAMGVDFGDLDEEYATACAERTDVGREVKRLQGVVDTLGPLTGAERVDAVELFAELEAAQEHNRGIDALGVEIEQVRGSATASRAVAETLKSQIDEIHVQIKELQGSITVIENDIAQCNKNAKSDDHEAGFLQARMDSMQRIDLVPIRERIDTIGEQNKAAAEDEKRRESAAELEAKQAESKKLTDEINGINTKKREILSSVDFPVDGLEFTEEGVTLNGQPFVQASTAEQIRTSVAVAMAANPDLRVIFIHEGSMLTPKSLQIVREMAAEKDYQVWVEDPRANPTKSDTIVIEDGGVWDPANGQSNYEIEFFDANA
jgi:hypothetical protein